ncbi:MAG: ferritin-like domain-containing protein [Thermoleophilaceae bacterium]
MSEKLVIIDGAVDTAVIAEYEATRRDAVRRGIVLGGAVIAATAIPTLLRVRTAFAQSDGDAAILEAAVGLEHTAVVAYDAAVGSGLLDATVKPVAELFRYQEQEHVDGLRTALDALGGMAPAPPKPAEVMGLSDLKSQADVANFAIELENMAVAAYYDAHGKLKDPKLLATGAQIMANEGQHLAVLRPLVNQPPVPDAFETGGQA